MMRSIRGRLLGFGLGLLAGLPPSLGQQPARDPVTVDVGGRPIRFVVAEDQCVLDRAQQADRAVLDLVTRALAGQNELLVHTAECANLTAVREGRTPYLDSFTQAQVLIQFREREFRGQETQVVREICQYMRNNAEALQKEVGPRIEKRISELGAGIGVNEQRPLGVVDEDQSACYSGLLMNLQTPLGDKRLLLGIFAVTVLNGRIIYLYRYQASPDDAARDRLLKLLKASVAAHVAANPAGLPGVKK